MHTPPCLSVDYGCEELVLERLQLRGDKGHNLVLTLALLELALLVRCAPR